MKLNSSTSNLVISVMFLVSRPLGKEGFRSKRPFLLLPKNQTLRFSLFVDSLRTDSWRCSICSPGKLSRRINRFLFWSRGKSLKKLLVGGLGRPDLGKKLNSLINSYSPKTKLILLNFF